MKPTAEDLRIRDTSFDAITYLSVISCTIIVLTAIFLSLHPLSKQKADRVSFRIMIYALIVSVVYSIATIIKNRVHGQMGCRLSGSFVVFSLHLSSFLFFCIGLNLQLVMVHGIDGTRAEKYYVSGSLLLAVALGILTYGSKQLAYNPTQSVCYYYDSNPVRGLWWRIASQYLWGLLTMTGEIITFASVVIYMVRAKVFDSKFGREPTPNRYQGVLESHQYNKPLRPQQYRNIVLRIALYPVSSLITSGIMAIGPITAPAQSTSSRSAWVTVNALRTIYMSRGLVYALVAAADPAITNGLRVLYKHYILRQKASTASNGVVSHPGATPDSGTGALELGEGGSKPEQGDQECRQASCYGSVNSVTLPSLPKAALLPPAGDTQFGTSQTLASEGTESQIDDTAHFSYSQL